MHAFVIDGDGKVKKHELRLPKKSTLSSVLVVGDDLAVGYRDEKYIGHFYWVSDPTQKFDSPPYAYYGGETAMATVLKDGGVFTGQHVVRPGDKQLPQSQPFFHDGERFWRLNVQMNPSAGTPSSSQGAFLSGVGICPAVARQ